MCESNVLLCGPQMGAGFGAPPAAMPASFNAPISGGLDDLFDLGGGGGMTMGTYIPPKSVSLDKLGCDIRMTRPILTTSNNIISDPNHVLNSEYELLPSDRRYRVPRFNKVRLKHPLCISQSSQ